MVSRMWNTYLKYNSQFGGKRTGKKLISTRNLESLPPTTEVFLLNVPPACYQACIWNSCLQPRPPKMDPCQVIRVSFVLYIIFWPFTFIYLEIGYYRRKKKMLIESFLPYLVILQNVHPFIKRNNLFYLFMLSQLLQSACMCVLVITPRCFCWRVLDSS